MKTVKHIRTSAIALSMISLLASGATLAEVKTNQQAAPDDWNKAFKNQPLNAKKTKGASAFDKSNQLRCWQHGDLIVLENDFRPVDGGKGKLLSKGSKTLHAYDYGETFCVYLGG
ncbi:MAG: hypothetical protein KTR18_05475 [Acidiferrobacterales bacterium]|nr:hypothetical protein [Acidiferrobacterales bacterium]